MIIKDGILLHVCEHDLDSSGILRIPEGVKDIAKGVGDKLKSLKKVQFPSSVHKIQNSIFNDNPELTVIDFGTSLQNITLFCFTQCPNIKTVYTTQNNERNLQWAEVNCPNIKTLIIYDSTGQQHVYDIKTHYDQLYYVSQHRKINSINIQKLTSITCLAGNNTLPKYAQNRIYISRQGSAKFFIARTLEQAIVNYRHHYLMQEFERKVWEYNATQKITETLENYEDVLRQALEKNLNSYTDTPEKREIIHNHIKNVSTYITYIQKFHAKYNGINDVLDELKGINIENLIKIIQTDANNAPKTTGKSCTKWLKRHPVTVDEMFAIVRAGYKNPGAFPYSWLKNIPKQKRGTVTAKLHKLFKSSASQLYSPSTKEAHAVENFDVLNKLSEQLSKLIHQDITIKYLDSGSFAKTYTLQIPGDKKYVWKIYHCDRSSELLNQYFHDTELQNSFLVSGKRYQGHIKFRKISTAGISNQRGEIYLIYPYTDAEPSRRRVYQTFSRMCPYSLIDHNSDNILGTTIIDVGALQIHHDVLNRPKYISKITNTILYHSWNDLGFILNNYSSQQIRYAIDFIGDKISSNNLEYDKIQAKIQFLKQKAKIR